MARMLARAWRRDGCPSFRCPHCHDRNGQLTQWAKVQDRRDAAAEISDESYAYRAERRVIAAVRYNSEPPPGTTCWCCAAEADWRDPWNGVIWCNYCKFVGCEKCA